MSLLPSPPSGQRMGIIYFNNRGRGDPFTVAVSEVSIAQFNLPPCSSPAGQLSAHLCHLQQHRPNQPHRQPVPGQTAMLCATSHSSKRSRNTGPERPARLYLYTFVYKLFRKIKHVEFLKSDIFVNERAACNNKPRKRSKYIHRKIIYLH